MLFVHYLLVYWQVFFMPTLTKKSLNLLAIYNLSVILRPSNQEKNCEECFLFFVLLITSDIVSHNHRFQIFGISFLYFVKQAS